MGQNQTRTPLKRGVRGGGRNHVRFKCLTVFIMTWLIAMEYTWLSFPFVVTNLCLIFSKGNTTVATSRAGIAYPSEVYEFIPGLWWSA